MHNNSISRRDALVVAGATLALSACGEASTVQESSIRTPIKTLSPDEVTAATEAYAQSLGLKKHGDGPNIDYPHKGKPEFPTYAPDYFMIIFVGAYAPWSIYENHAVFKYQNGKPADRFAEALKILKKKKAEPSKPFSNLGKVAEGRWPGQTTPAKRDHLQFDVLGFGSQHDIYIYFDHRSPGGKDEIQFDPTLENVIIFSEYHFSGTPTAKNHSFYNLKKIEKTTSKLEEGTLFTLENWFTDDYGKPINPGTQIHYKMNFLYTSNTVPMLIDPDTGNGTSWEP